MRWRKVAQASVKCGCFALDLATCSALTFHVTAVSLDYSLGSGIAVCSARIVISAQHASQVSTIVVVFKIFAVAMPIVYVCHVTFAVFKSCFNNFCQVENQSEIIAINTTW